MNDTKTWEQRFDDYIIKFLVTRISRHVVREFISQEITRAREEVHAEYRRNNLPVEDRETCEICGKTLRECNERAIDALTPSAEGEEPHNP